MTRQRSMSTWWLCASSCCFSSSSNWTCWLALVGSDWLEHWKKLVGKLELLSAIQYSNTGLLDIDSGVVPLLPACGRRKMNSYVNERCFPGIQHTCCNMRSVISSLLRRSSTSNFIAAFSCVLSFICSDSSELCCFDSSLKLLWTNKFWVYFKLAISRQDLGNLFKPTLPLQRIKAFKIQRPYKKNVLRQVRIKWLTLV